MMKFLDVFISKGIFWETFRYSHTLVGSSSLSLSSELFTSLIKSDSFFIDVSDVSTLLKDVEFLGHGSCLVQTDRGLSPVIFLFFKKENQYMEFVYHTTWKGLSEEPKFLFYQTDSIYDLSLQNCDFVWMRQKTFKFVPSIDMDEAFSTHMFKMYVVEKILFGRNYVRICE